MIKYSNVLELVDRFCNYCVLLVPYSCVLEILSVLITLSLNFYIQMYLTLTLKCSHFNTNIYSVCCGGPEMFEILSGGHLPC